LLPRLSLEQVRAALRYYAEYPDEIDQILAEGEAKAVKARLYRSLGPASRGLQPKYCDDVCWPKCFTEIALLLWRTAEIGAWIYQDSPAL
jgi:hypothetical protein